MTERSPPRWRPTTSSTRSVRFAGRAAVISSSIRTSGSIASARARSMIRSDGERQRAARASTGRGRSSPSSSSQWRNGSTRRLGQAQVVDRMSRSGMSGRLLVDGDEPAAARLGRRVDGALRPRTAIVPAVGPDGAGQDLDEGALAGAVGAHERVDLAGPDGERTRDCSATTAPYVFETSVASSSRSVAVTVMVLDGVGAEGAGGAGALRSGLARGATRPCRTRGPCSGS